MHNLARLARTASRMPCRYAVRSANEIRAQGTALPHETDRSRGLPQHLVPRIHRILADLDVPGYRLHPLKGAFADCWSVRVSDKLRLVFRFRDGEPVDVDVVDYH